MKKFSIAFLLGISVSMAAQTEDNYHFDDYITPVFDDMFGYLDDPLYIPETNPPADPPVPLDGGLTALLLAGGATGYRQIRKRRKSK